MAVELHQLPVRVAAVSHRSENDRSYISRVRAPRAGVVAVAVAIAYYAGAKVGLALTFPPYPVSVLWPPNAILFACLLLVPARTWWLLVLAALPAHLMAELQDRVPLSMVLLWFVSNVAQALIGAVLVRRYAPAIHLRPDGVRNTAALLAFGAFVAPLFASFLDAAFVTMLRWGESRYWELFTNRFFSNVTATLMIVPVVLALSAQARLRRPTVNAGAFFEGFALFTGLLVSCVFVFDLYAPHPNSQGLLYLPLPFLLWAAVRFGMAGTSVAFMLTTLLVILGATHGHGPLLSSALHEQVLLIQLLLISMAVPLYALTAVIAERNKSEAALRASEERYRTSSDRFGLVLEATKDVVYDWDVRRGNLWLNSNGAELFGEHGRAYRRHPLFWSDRVQADDREHLKKLLTALVGGTSTKWEAEYRVHDEAGRQRLVSERGFVRRGDDGAALRMIGTIMDVTDRQRAEEATEGLAHAARLAVMGELTASIAHELNQPLGAILSNVDAADILLQSGSLKTEELRQILDDIRKDDIRAAEVIRHIRTLLRKRRMEMLPFDLNRAIIDALTLASGDLRRRHIVVQTLFLPLPILHGDQVHIQQVMLNLLLNAADAMSGIAGPRLLDIRTARTQDGGAEVCVSDSGPGIPPENIARLFDSFFTTKEEGTGLGLSIARTIVRSHGGEIWAEPRARGGTSFRFTIPPARVKQEVSLERSPA
jgi:signal transduction histidine kinase